MALRSIDIVLPGGELEALKGALRGDVVQGGPWRMELEGGTKLIRLIVDADDSGRVVDAIEHRCGSLPGFHLTLQAVEATLPRPKEPEPEPAPPPRAEDALPRLQRLIFGPGKKRLSREELYSDAMDMSGATRMYFATVFLSTVVAAVGLLKGSPAIIIGAMVIAPLLGPIMGLALAATLADGPLARRAAKSGLLGVGLAMLLSVGLGALATPDWENKEIQGRLRADPSDLVLAVAAGSAGTLALTTGVSTGLVGVMVAVALMPPTVVLGMALGAGALSRADGAALLLATNVLGILLAGIATFRLQGVRPGTWWEAAQARTATRWAMGLLAMVLGAITALLLLGKS